MPELNIQQKVIAFVQQNPQYEGKSAESVLSAMLASGEITQKEIDNLKSNNKNSTFGFGFETDYPLDLALEKPYSEHGEISTTPTTQTQKRTVDFVQKRYEKAQTDFDKQMLEDGWAADVADKFSVIWGSDNRAKKVRKDLEIASLQAEQLKIAAEESSDAFKLKFKEIYGIEYNAQNIEAFERDEKAYLEALEAKNKEDAFNQHFEKLLNEDLADEFKTVGGGNSGATQTIKIPKEEIYEQEFKKLAEMFGEGGEEFLNEYIKQAQAEDFAVDGFSAGTGTVEYKWNLLKKLAQGMSNRFATETAKACNGSSIEALEKRYENSYKSAFGNNNDIQKRVNDYNISQQKGAGVVKMVALSVAMIAISIATMGTGTAASVPAVAGATATAGTASSAAASGGVLLSIAKSAVTVASLSAGIEISDRFSSGAALKALREEGVLEYLETASEMTNWSQVAKASLSAGAMCVVFGGVSYAVSNLTRVAGTALKMSELGIAYASAATTSASTVATGLGVEYLMTGEISVEGTIFTVTMAVIGGVTQVMQIKKATPQFEQAREQLKTDGEIALKILDFQPGEEVTLETIKAHTAERAMKYVSSSNSTPEKQYMQLQFIQASHDLLTANITEIQNLLKTGGINLAVAQQNFTYNYSPSTTQTYPQISAPQMGLATPQTRVPLAMPEVPSIATQTGVSTVGQTSQPAVTGLGFGIAQNSAPEYVPPQVSTVEIVPEADLCVSEGASSSNSIGFIDRIKSFFGIEKTAPIQSNSENISDVQITNSSVPQKSNLDLSNFEFKQHNYANNEDYRKNYLPIKRELHAKRMEAFGSEEELPPPKSVSKSQINAMYNIQCEMGEYFKAREKLRAGEALNDAEQRFVDSVMEAMTPTTAERTVWRSIESYDGLVEQIRTGKISEDFFSSTASEYSDFYDFWTNEHRGYDENGIVITEGCMLKINVLEGTPILDCNAVYEPFIGKKQYTRMRGEVVLPPGDYVIRNYDPELKIFEVDFVPKNNTPRPSSPVATPQVSKPKWTPEKAIKAIEDMCPKDDSKDYFLNVRAKDFIEAIPNMDMVNMDLYLEVIKTAIDYNINTNYFIVKNGYLSSKEGAETFLKLKKMFPYNAKRAREWKRQELDHVVASIEAKNFQSALDRGLFEKYGNDYNKINRVAGYTEKQYAQMTEFEAQGIGYISDNDEINRILLAYGKKVELPYLLEKFSNDLIKTFENDEVAIKSAVDKLISYDNHKVVSTFNEIQDKKYALDNMDDLILFEQRLTSALDEAKLPSLDYPWANFHEVKACYRNDSIKTILEIFKSGRFSDLEVAKIALKAKTGNAEHLDFISKLTKSDLDNETIVNLIEKICMPTYDRTYASMNAWYEAEEYPLKLDLYNALKALDTKTKQVLKSCGYDADAVIKDLSVIFDRTVTVSDVSVANQRKYVQNVLSNNNPTAENVFKNFDFSQFGEQGLPLKYTRADFNSNVENILSTLSNEEQNMLLQHFGLKRGVVGFEGLPSNKPFEGNGSAQVMQAASKIQQEIENFTLKNEVMINDPEAKAVFDALIQGFPEFTSIVGKVQHGTHAYTVDIHTLKVLQDVMNDPYYNRLSDTDKTVVKFAVLMHDFGKRGGIVDTGHATLSTDYASSILERYPFSNELKQRITDTVKLHHWFEAYNKGNATAMDVAINCRNNADYYIMRMFAKADLGNVNPTFHLGKISQGATNQAEFDAFFERQMKPIYDARMQINSKSSPIYTSRFVKNGDMFSRETAVVNGQAREYRVLNLSQLSAGEDMQKYGFAPGTTKENFAMLSHMTENNSASLESVIRVMLDPNKDSSWSLSLFNDEYNQFYGDRCCGIIVDTELKNIVDASRENMHSGTKKNTADAVRSFDSALRFNRDPQSKKVFLNSLRKNGVKLNDYEYAEVIDALLDNKWQSQNNKDIVLSNGRVLKVADLQKALDDVRDSIIGSNQNEVVARNPIPSALIYRAKSLSECPAWFLELADKYNLPIVLK